MKAMMVNNSSLQSSWALLTLQGELSAQRTSSMHGCPLSPQLFEPLSLQMTEDKVGQLQSSH